MSKGPEPEDEQPETKDQASTPQIDRLEKLANAAATAAQAKPVGGLGLFFGAIRRKLARLFGRRQE